MKEQIQSNLITKKISLFAMVKFFDKAQKVIPKNVLQTAKSYQMLVAKTSSKKLYY